MEDQPKKKKPYSKPTIFYEEFKISTHLAADCEVTATHQQYMCGTEDNLFSLQVASGCRYPYVTSNMEGSVYMGKRYPCYTTYTENYNVFNS